MVGDFEIQNETAVYFSPHYAPQLLHLILNVKYYDFANYLPIYLPINAWF